MIKVFIAYLIVINLYGIFVMYSDKKKAKNGQWRVPEARLFLVAVLLGSPGIMAGMKMFRHKTKHFKFVFGVPIIFFIQLYLMYRLIK